MSQENRESFGQPKPSERTGIIETLWQNLVAIAPGLQNLWSEVIAEGKRLLTHGAMETASALNNGHGFVQYGPGQYTASAEQGTGVADREGSDEKERLISAVFKGTAHGPYSPGQHGPSDEREAGVHGREGSDEKERLISAVFKGTTHGPSGPGQSGPSAERDTGAHGREVSDGKGEAQQERQREEQGRGM